MKRGRELLRPARKQDNNCPMSIVSCSIRWIPVIYRHVYIQASADEIFDDRPQSAFYNIWYDKAEDFSSWKERRDAKIAGKRYALDIENDLGDTVGNDSPYICLYFARGKCIHGFECKFRHRLPSGDDEARNDIMHDVFGRERHRVERDDMGGVGSFNRPNKTLYISGARTTSPDAENVIRQAFESCLTITVKIISGRSMVFLTFKWRCSAEFAKEAMADQPLAGAEVINVRWAHDDPNQVQTSEEDLQGSLEAYAAMKAAHPEYFEQYEQLEAGVYPDTSQQYSALAMSQAPLYLENTMGPPQNWVQIGDATTGYYWVSSESINQKQDETPANNSTETPGQENDAVKDGLQEETSNEPARKRPRNDPTPGKSGDKEQEEKAYQEHLQRQQYEAWQFYAANAGYPFYYDAEGRLVYYDPNSTAQAAPTPSQLQDQELGVSDNYQLYAPSQVYSTEAGTTTGEYYSLVQNYST